MLTSYLNQGNKGPERFRNLMYSCIAILVDIKGALGLGEDVRAGMMVCIHGTGDG